MKVRAVVLVLAAALALAGCSKEIEGTPMADPAATVSETPTTTRPPRTIEIPIPSFPNLPIPTPGGPPPTGLAATTCGDYQTMDKTQQRQVIDAIGKDNQLVQMNPELWLGLASAMCAFTPKTTLVRDAVAGQGFR
ncbi:hypothetical protein C1S82_09955 [Mycolicibacterium cosmeticum]|uniref:Uncharacterized protein n=1 Tax=Mycolicibacterium cosmeticum TaxID=258533 RepID=W9BLC5_MYCCO|nr:hypothetical protein [Mycolicibacterium cosmeticum]TLH74874.1 hypothetical protein C1S82_09955 [Mycolicibacterium cosmeticum]CDO09410.1 hypothetical protein BN977_04233 [Mycolicibacterium cosmeticum]